jgi:uncharacterized protein (UPF0305 family)
MFEQWEMEDRKRNEINQYKKIKENQFWGEGSKLTKIIVIFFVLSALSSCIATAFKEDPTQPNGLDIDGNVKVENDEIEDYVEWKSEE